MSDTDHFALHDANDHWCLTIAVGPTVHRVPAFIATDNEYFDISPILIFIPKA
ncbi:MAG: hypothetical protein ACAH06_06905 [Methylophilaceae bacterium]|jgi:hypothetical protein|uniref:hypothetical protein n=1 Tax=Methylobacillus sp. MM3 TaxID=1848039 RepID=UPI0013F4CD02|nr:hypothetical protein [Methylobacillus sp. MM3]